MAISLTTDWCKKRYIMFVVFFVSALMASTVANGLNTSGKDYRQLFREHLLPQQGGKIPDGAFAPDRLILNKFNQNGLFSLDGFHLEERYPNRVYHHKTPFPNTLKLHLPPDNRYVAPAGRDYAPRIVDTTYLIREPVNYVIHPVRHYSPIPVTPITSLRIWHSFKFGLVPQNNRYYHKNNVNNENSASADDFPSKVLMEYAPYLQKLHQYD